MAGSTHQPQPLRLRQRTHARPRQTLTPTCVHPDQFRAANTARWSNEAACPHPPRRFPPEVAPTPTSAAVRNHHSRRLWPAGSFLGDFRTPPGARNSSRKRSDCFGSRRGIADVQIGRPEVAEETFLHNIQGHVCRLILDKGEWAFLKNNHSPCIVVGVVRCGLVKPSRASPLHTSGAPIKSFHRSPVR